MIKYLLGVSYFTICARNCHIIVERFQFINILPKVFPIFFIPRVITLKKRYSVNLGITHEVTNTSSARIEQIHPSLHLR